MSMEVTVPEEHLSSVLGDLAQRRGTVQDIQSRHDNKVLLATVPLAEMMVRWHPIQTFWLQFLVHPDSYLLFIPFSFERAIPPSCEHWHPAMPPSPWSWTPMRPWTLRTRTPSLKDWLVCCDPLLSTLTLFSNGTNGLLREAWLILK